MGGTAPGPADDGAATQLIPPVGAAPPPGPAGDADDTQLIQPLSGPYEAPGPGAYDPQAAAAPRPARPLST
ncbi:hypothetical protein [Streptomyces synnematoformans]|uniref:hypothetical protein n=1 Tax=Streptomyces synnematoformans TaxID=415721 RepID=UPI0031E48A6B